MDQISFRCSTCENVIKVSAERAGRKVKCNRCDAVLTIPSSSNGDAAAGITASPPKKAAPKPPPPKPADDDEDDGDKGGYGLMIDPREEEEKKRRAEEERKARKKKKDEPAAQIQRRVKTIYDAKDWDKVRIGLVIMMFALIGWGLQVLLHEVVVLIGLIRGPEYNNVLILATEPLADDEFGDPGKRDWVNRPALGMGLVSGSGLMTLGKIFFLLGQVSLLVMGGMFISSYYYFRNIPDRYGIRTLIKGVIFLGFFNLTVGLFLKVIPMATGFGPTLFPLFAPEMPMGNSNIERLQPIHASWMYSPFWEMLLSLILQLCFFAEPFLVGVILWSAARILQEDVLEEQCHGLTMLAGGVYFIQFSYLILSLTGTSEVLVNFLIVTYILGLGFLIGFIIRFAVVLNNFRLKVEKLVADTLAEERKTGKKKKTRRLFPSADEEEEDEDEDDEDDEDDDD